MLERHLRQSTVFQASNRDRVITGLVVAAAQGLLFLILVLGLAGRPAIVEGPVMALLLPQSGESKLPAPTPARITIANPSVRAPEIAITPERPADRPAPSPVQVTAAAITAPPNESESLVSASAASGGAGPGAGSDGASQSAAGRAGSGGIDISEYLRRVSLHIQRFIPRGMPRGTPDKGLTYVYLHWTQDGTVVSKRLIQSSGDEWIDRSALLAVTRANRLPPIPPEFRMKELEGRLPVLFSR